MARGNRLILGGCKGAAAVLLLLLLSFSPQRADAKAFPGEDDGASNRLKRSTSSSDDGTTDDDYDAVVVGAAGDGTDVAGVIPVVNNTNTAAPYLLLATGDSSETVVGKRSGDDDDDLAVVTDAAADGTETDSPTPVATVNSGAAGFRLPNFGTVPADEKLVIVDPYNQPDKKSIGFDDDVFIVDKRRGALAGGRTGDGFGLGVDHDYNYDDYNENSQASNQGAGVASSTAGASTTAGATNTAGAANTAGATNTAGAANTLETSNIGNTGSSSSSSSGGYGSQYNGNAGGSYNQGFNPTNQYKPNQNSGSGLNNIIPGGDLLQNIGDSIPFVGSGPALTNGINAVGSGIGNYVNALGQNINRPLNNLGNQLNQNLNQNQNAAQQRPTGLGNSNPLNCGNNNFNVDPSLCPHYIPQATHQDNNNNFNLQSLNPLSPRPGATPIAGPGQGSQATYRLPTGQGFRPNEATQIVSPNQNYNGLSGSPINYLTGGNPTNLIPGSQVLNSLGLGKRK